MELKLYIEIMTTVFVIFFVIMIMQFIALFLIGMIAKEIEEIKKKVKEDGET